MAWKGESRRHSLARKGIRTRKFQDRRLKKPIIVTWIQEDRDEKLVRVSKEFKNKKDAEEHIIKIKKSAENLNKPVEILSIKEKGGN